MTNTQTTYYQINFIERGSERLLHVIKAMTGEPGITRIWLDRDEADTFCAEMNSVYPGNQYTVVFAEPATILANGYDVPALIPAEDDDLATRNERQRVRIEDQCVQIERLTADLERMRAARDTAMVNHQQDIERIGETMIEKANDNNMCSVYDDAVDELNRRLHIALPVREHDYTVTFRVMVEVPVSVTARDDDSAAKRAWDELSRDDAISTLRSDGWENADVWSIDKDD